jgi:regulatory protein
MPSEKRSKKQSKSRSQTKANGEGRPFDEVRIHATALAYLNRFDASASGLHTVLMRTVRRSLARTELSERDRLEQVAAAERHVVALVERFQASGLIDDARLARHLVSSWRERGLSARAIQARLVGKGVPSRVVEAAITELAQDPQQRGSELDAAVAFAKRRRLGCFGPSAVDRAAQRRDLARMARAGFDFDVALRALNVRVEDDTF